jgi:hypothetical protein
MKPEQLLHLQIWHSVTIIGNIYSTSWEQDGSKTQGHWHKTTFVPKCHHKWKKYLNLYKYTTSNLLKTYVAAHPHCL